MRDGDTCTIGHRNVPTAPRHLFMHQPFPNDAPIVNGAGRKLKDFFFIIKLFVFLSNVLVTCPKSNEDLAKAKFALKWLK